jgi:hypothetical protein
MPATNLTNILTPDADPPSLVAKALDLSAMLETSGTYKSTDAWWIDIQAKASSLFLTHEDRAPLHLG